MLERVVALAVVAGGGFYLSQALALPFGTAARPGAAFFPVAVAIVACVVGLVATVRTFLAVPVARTPRVAESGDAEARGRVISTVVVLVAFCLLLPWLGYPAAAFGFVVALLRRLGSRWSAAVAIAAVSAAGSFYLFAVLLDVPLPGGRW
jgi:putative tricarboxylic transport membrane protein